jgi:DNA-binding NtrC family response regulator
MKILLIDDEEKIIELLVESLMSDGHQVSGFINPKEALKVFFNTPSEFDVIVTDHIMPSILGTEVIKQVKSQYPNFPIVLATGNYTEDLKTNFKIDLFPQLTILQKPFRKDALIKRIQLLLDSTSPEIL